MCFRVILHLWYSGHGICFAVLLQWLTLFSRMLSLWRHVGVINTADSGMQGYRSELTRLPGLGVGALLASHGLFTMREAARSTSISRWRGLLVAFCHAKSIRGI